MKEKTIVLPAELGARRRLLEAELSETITALVEERLEANLKELLNEAGFTEGTATVEWDFYGEYDDEGGTYHRPTDYQLSVNGESVDIDEFDEEHEDFYLRDYLSDVVCDFARDLYNQDIFSVTITLH